MKDFITLRLVGKVVEDWDNTDYDLGAEDALEAIRELVGAPKLLHGELPAIIGPASPVKAEWVEIPIEAPLTLAETPAPTKKKRKYPKMTEERLQQIRASQKKAVEARRKKRESEAAQTPPRFAPRARARRANIRSPRTADQGGYRGSSPAQIPDPLPGQDPRRPAQRPPRLPGQGLLGRVPGRSPAGAAE